MNTSLAILATLAYHDIFNYPLSAQELHNYLIKVKISDSNLNTQLTKLIKNKIVKEKSGFYFLKKREEIVKIRQSRRKISSFKYKKAKIYALLLKLIPTIRFVGISGALSMENTTKNDDIDLVIITKSGYLWTTRFLVNVLLFPVKRRPGSPKTNNRACLNLFLDESDLQISNSNLYLAHEICQLKPLWQRNNAYFRFIKANKWIYKFLPNWQPQLITNLQPPIKNESRGKTSKLQIIEKMFKKFQLFYMRKKVSTEQIGETQLFFHPSNAQEKILNEYNKRLLKLKITSMR